MTKFVLKINRKTGGRLGVLQTKSGKVPTPFFMPIATRGAVKMIEPEEVASLGYELILSNTYHLWRKPGEKVIKKAGGLGKFMHWKKPILTDSGGYQAFSLGARAQTRFGVNGVKITDQGVHFVDPENGEKLFLSPEKAIQIQLDLGVDILMCLDECPAYPATKKQVGKAVERTAAWAERSLKFFQKKTKHLPKNKRPLLFAIVQGGVYEDLRRASAEQLTKMNFDGWAIGGVAVGEPREKLPQILDWVLPILPADKPRYLMGLGRPEELVLAVAKGVDMFDCVIPTREGRHGRFFVWEKEAEKKMAKISQGESFAKNKFYHQENISNEKNKSDQKPLDENCACPVCQKFSRSYLRHLFSVGETLGMKSVALHNLFFYRELMRRIGKRITRNT